MKQRIRKIGNILLNLYLYIGAGFVVLLFLYIFLNVFVYATFSIPSTSMYPIIQPGDKVYVDKTSTGARLLDLRDVSSARKSNVYRTPHWRNFKKGDILVFNFKYRESWDTIAMNWPLYYIKRCLGEPGDTIVIRNFTYFVNGIKEKGEDQSKQMEHQYPPDSLAMSENLRGYVSDPTDSIDRWSIRNFGPFVVPKAGQVMPIDTITYRRYKQMIEWETDKPLLVKNGKVILGNDTINAFKFAQNYYFMAGDNRNHSMDSRYWGLIPEDFIVGRALFVIWSKSKKDGKFRWDRFLKKLE